MENISHSIFRQFLKGEDNMKEKLIRFMQGRYGVDQLSKFLLIVGLAIILISAFFGGHVAGMICYVLGWVVLIYCYFRTFSRNVSKRYAENQTFLTRTYRVRSFFRDRRAFGHRGRIIIFIHARHVSRKYVSREEKAGSRYAARNAGQHL